MRPIFDEIDMIIKNNNYDYWKKLIDKVYQTKPLRRIVDLENKFNNGKKYLGKPLFKSPYFVKKDDCSPKIEKNIAERENERIKMQTKLTPKESEFLKNKLEEIKSKLLSNIDKDMPDIIENEDDREVMEKMAYLQRNALKSLSRE